MKLATTLIAAAIAVTGFSAAHAEKMYNMRGKIVSESFYIQLIIHCPTRKTFFEEHNYECKEMKKYGKRRRPPLTHVVADDTVLKMLQNRDGLKKDGSGGSINQRQRDRNHQKD